MWPFGKKKNQPKQSEDRAAGLREAQAELGAQQARTEALRAAAAARNTVHDNAAAIRANAAESFEVANRVLIAMGLGSYDKNTRPDDGWGGELFTHTLVLNTAAHTLRLVRQPSVGPNPVSKHLQAYLAQQVVETAEAIWPAILAQPRQDSYRKSFAEALGYAALAIGPAERPFLKARVERLQEAAQHR
jgi:hypothetical protein